MRETRLIMGMPITVEIVDSVPAETMDAAFALFEEVDRRFSPYRADSELCRHERGEIPSCQLSAEMREVFALAQLTRQETHGYFDIRRPDGRIDPSGIVKGWAVRKAAHQLLAGGAVNFQVEAGGDIQAAGRNADGEDWRIGIRNPFNDTEIVKVVRIAGRGIATSGTYARGAHIYDPTNSGHSLSSIVSLTVVASDVLEADRFATAAFAMGIDGILFIEEQPGLEGYMIGADGVATMTTGFRAFELS